MPMTRIRRGDICILAGILAVAGLLSLFLLLPKEEGRALEVVCGDEVFTYWLDKDAELQFENNGYTLQVTIKDGEAFVSHADCPDKVCLYHKGIDQAGETVICVPAGILLRVLGGDDVDYDIIAG